MKHQQEIESTRRGGFGGSDAKMIYKIGLKGIESLNNTDKIRIAVAKGLREYKPIKRTEAMNKGHEFEQWYAKQPFAPIERETLISADITDKFKTFAHADFYDPHDREVWELKFLQHPDDADSTYREQLQWYYMLGSNRVWLVVGDSSLPFDQGVRLPVAIAPDENMISTLINGITILSDNWDNIDLSIGDEWDSSDLLPFEESEVVTLANYLMEIKRLEAQAEDRKAKVLEFMEQNNIKSISSDFYNVSYIPASTASTFDKKKLLKDHPEINESDYIKLTDRKPYVKVTIK